MTLGLGCIILGTGCDSTARGGGCNVDVIVYCTCDLVVLVVMGTFLGGMALVLLSGPKRALILLISLYVKSCGLAGFTPGV